MYLGLISSFITEAEEKTVNIIHCNLSEWTQTHTKKHTEDLKSHRGLGTGAESRGWGYEGPKGVCGACARASRAAQQQGLHPDG